jgi:hypothetical protein
MYANDWSKASILYQDNHQIKLIKVIQSSAKSGNSSPLANSGLAKFTNPGMSILLYIVPWFQFIGGNGSF